MRNEWCRFCSHKEPPCSLLYRDPSAASDPEAASQSDEGNLLLLNTLRLGFAETTSSINCLLTKTSLTVL